VAHNLADRQRGRPLNMIVRRHEMSTTAISEEMKTAVRARVAQLREKPFQELAALPGVDTARLEIRGKPVQMNVYRTPHAEDGVLVIVQAARPRYLGIFTETRVEGFVARRTGELTDAPENLLWPYI
jgi:hypothetical protein